MKTKRSSSSVRAAPTVGQIGERALIRRLVRALPSRPDVVVGPGDDAAVVRLPGARDEVVLKADAVVEGVHFLGTDPAALVGRKAAARVLSDFAAMGATPLHLLVDLVAPPTLSLRRVQQAYAGLAALARGAGASVIGGETVRGRAFELHVFGMGTVGRGTAVLRSGAHPGDVVFVTGELGGSRAGRHLAFEPRLREGAWLRAQRWATAMIDLSDGVATDLDHLVRASGVGADLDAHRIPVSADVRQGGGRGPALQHALCDGEDFELLFTVRRGHVAAFVKAWRSDFALRCTAIGAVTDRPGVIRLREVGGLTRRLKPGGYEHFRARPGSA